MNLAPTLKAAIQSYLDADKRRSLSTLARKTGVSYATIRRLAQGEIKEPQLDNVLQVCAVIMTYDETIQLLENYNSDIARWLRTKRDRDFDFADQSDFFAFEAPDVFIIAHAATQKGLTSELVVETFGRYGIQRLKALEEAGYVEQLKGTYRTKKKNFVDMNPLSVLSRMQLSLEQFDLERLNSGAFYRFFTGEVSEQQKADIIKIIQETDAKLADVFNREDEDQNEVMFVGKFGNFF